MRKIIVLLFCVSFVSNAFSQRHEIGVMVGNPNLIADIGKTNHIQPLPLSINPELITYSAGLLYRYNLTPRQSLRFNLNYNHVRFDDRTAREDYRLARKKNGFNDIIEASAVYEYYFYDINDEIEFDHSPYIFAGLAAFMYKDRNYNIYHTLSTDFNGNEYIPTSETDFTTNVSYDEEYKSGLAIPFGIGYKIKFNWNWLISVEVGVRGTNTDRLDYSFSTPEQYEVTYNPDLLASPYNHAIEMYNREVDFKLSNQTGNLKSTDWYVITGVGLTYTFGRPPCYCD